LSSAGSGLFFVWRFISRLYFPQGYTTPEVWRLIACLCFSATACSLPDPTVRAASNAAGFYAQ